MRETSDWSNFILSALMLIIVTEQDMEDGNEMKVSIECFLTILRHCHSFEVIHC